MTLRQLTAVLHPGELQLWQALYTAEANEHREAQRAAERKAKSVG